MDLYARLKPKAPHSIAIDYHQPPTCNSHIGRLWEQSKGRSLRRYFAFIGASAVLPRETAECHAAVVFAAVRSTGHHVNTGHWKCLRLLVWHVPERKRTASGSRWRHPTVTALWIGCAYWMHHDGDGGDSAGISGMLEEVFLLKRKIYLQQHVWS